MTLRRLTEVVFRIWGVIVVMRAGTVAAQQLVWTVFGEHLEMPPTRIANLVAWFVVGVALFIFAPRIAARLAPEDEIAPVNLTSREMFVLAVSVLALYFVVSGGRELVAAAYTMATKPGWDERPMREYGIAERWNTLVGGAFELIAGFVLLSRRHVLAARLGE